MTNNDYFEMSKIDNRYKICLFFLTNSIKYNVSSGTIFFAIDSYDNLLSLQEFETKKYKLLELTDYLKEDIAYNFCIIENIFIQEIRRKKIDIIIN